MWVPVVAAIGAVIGVGLVVSLIIFYQCRGRCRKVVELEKQLTALRLSQASTSMVEVTIDEPLVGSGPVEPASPRATASNRGGHGGGT